MQSKSSVNDYSLDEQLKSLDLTEKVRGEDVNEVLGATLLCFRRLEKCTRLSRTRNF